MSVYCISDIHGCHDEFLELLGQIQFNPSLDTLYVLGDVIDRGDKSLDCLQFVWKTKGVHLIMGNHEKMMLDYFEKRGDNWFVNGGRETFSELRTLPQDEREKLIAYVSSRPLYKTISVNGKRYFLSHAGLDPKLPFSRQPQDVLVWGRDEFYNREALKGYTCIFGHTPTPILHANNRVSRALMKYTDILGQTPKPRSDDRDNCSVWFDTLYNDKICIDCGCVYGGALSALRLDDGKTFYIKSDRGKNPQKYTL